jgi:hypothetical protein
MTIRFEVYGVKDAVRELRDYDRQMYDRIINDLKSSAQPLATKVGSQFPDQPFRRINNWHSEGNRRGDSKMPPYNSGKARAGVKPSISTSNRKSATGQVGILRLQQMDAGGQIYDSAGSGSKASRKDPVASGWFIRNLDKPWKTKSRRGKWRSRVLYPAMEQNMDMVEEKIKLSIEKTNKIVENHIMGKAS